MIGRAQGVRSVAALLATLLLGPAAAATPAFAADDTSGAITSTDAFVAVGAEPDGTRVSLDTTTYEPASGTDHPAVLLAHGFGGSKADLAQEGMDLARGGYVAVTWTARGFGKSGGRIHLDDPDYEIADARKLVDLLATKPEVRLDSQGDPRVGVAGGSYGGALGLMLAATDPRIDAVVSSITWNNLADAFFPQNATAPTSSAAAPSAPASPAQVVRADKPGPFKQLWASRFFVGTATAGVSISPTCGRFDPTICKLFLDVSRTGEPSAALLELLRDHSPAPLLSKLTAPTFLVQGMRDTLFGLDQADATARTLTAQGTPVAVRWMDGGHDGVSSTADADAAAQRTWLDHYLLPATKPSTGENGSGATLPVPSFAFATPLAARQTSATFKQGTQPYATAPTVVTEPVADTSTLLLNPPGGQPSSVSNIPGLGSLAASLPTYALAALSGQSAAYDTPAFTVGRDIVGAPHIRLTVTSTASTATLFLSLWQVNGSTVTLPRSIVAPVTVSTTPGTPTTVDVALPAATWTVPQGSSLRVLVTSTDSTYAAPRTAQAYQVTVADLRLPEVAATLLGSTSGTPADTQSIGVLVAIAVLLLLLVGSAVWRRRRRATLLPRPELADVPLVVAHLVKTYSDGHRAVDDVSWRAERGQVVGLLGPNGAGKTTTLRMVMGLIRADSGTVHILGQPVTSGDPVLARVGALIEGPGFLPHLTGRQNLDAYWAATGRDPAEAAIDEVLDVAALGGAIDRPVRSYSQGMRQRLGIAQAMLGLPEVLILDEPTNGLDPPQIAAMRPILQRYAAGSDGRGRTVVVSSHLLAEVEMTCSHVVVMHAGRVIVSGTVAELVDSSDTTVIEVEGDPSHMADVAARLAAVDGIAGVEVADDGATSRLLVTAHLPRADVVRAAAETGAAIVGVSSRKHLEEVFLGVIAAASSSPDTPTEADPRSLTERLRQVRAR